MWYPWIWRSREEEGAKTYPNRSGLINEHMINISFRKLIFSPSIFTQIAPLSIFLMHWSYFCVRVEQRLTVSGLWGKTSFGWISIPLPSFPHTTIFEGRTHHIIQLLLSVSKPLSKVHVKRSASKHGSESFSVPEKPLLCYKGSKGVSPALIWLPLII